jgi:hypothetical protein
LLPWLPNGNSSARGSTRHLIGGRGMPELFPQLGPPIRI